MDIKSLLEIAVQEKIYTIGLSLIINDIEKFWEKF